MYVVIYLCIYSFTHTHIYLYTLTYVSTVYKFKNEAGWNLKMCCLHCACVYIHSLHHSALDVWMDS